MQTTTHPLVQAIHTLSDHNEHIDIQERQQAVCVILEQAYALIVQQHTFYDEALQRLAVLWLTNPPSITCHSNGLTLTQAIAFLKTSLRRSKGSLRRYSQRFYQNNIENNAVICTEIFNIDRKIDRELEYSTALNLIGKSKMFADMIVQKYASRRDQRDNLSSCIERLIMLAVHSDFEDWFEQQCTAQNFSSPDTIQKFKNRVHTQHKRTRMFLRECIDDFQQHHDDVDPHIIEFLLFL